MLNTIKRLIEDKKAFNNQIARADALPPDYKFVFDKIMVYIWSFASWDGSDILKVQTDLLDLFEASALEGKNVLDVTGKDVAGFCDEFLHDAKKWMDGYNNRFSRKIRNKLGN